MATYYYDTNGATAGFGNLDGNWNTADAVWSTSSAGTVATAAVTFTSADTAYFGFTGTSATAGAVSVTVNTTVGNIITENLGGSTQTITEVSGTLTLNGTITTNTGSHLSISGVSSGQVSKAGPGDLTLGSPLNGTGYNTLTSLTEGRIICTSPRSIGSTGSIYNTFLGSGTTLAFSNCGTITKTSSIFSNQGCTLDNLSGTNTLNCSGMAMGASFGITAAAATTFTYASTIYNGNSAYTLTINGSGTGIVRLTATNSSYVSATAVSAGTLEVALVANAGTNSSIGAPAAGQATIALGPNSAAISYIGSIANNTSSRPLKFSGGAGTTLTVTSNATGSGYVNWSDTSDLFTASGSKTLLLAGIATGQNVLAAGVTDPPTSGVTSITKSGAGYWSLTGTLTATGVITINAGTLHFGAIDRTLTGGLTINGGIVSNGTTQTLNTNATFTAGATVNCAFAGASKTITVQSGCTTASPAVLSLTNTTGSSSNTGNATISGCIDLNANYAMATSANGRFLGVSNTVTVAGTGIIRTKSQSLQQGSARYNNLTFQNGGQLQIGTAA